MAENINISPDMINNLVNMLKNNTNGSSNSEQQSQQNSEFASSPSDTSDSRGIFSDLGFNVDANSSANTSNLDFDTIMKIKSIMDTLNNNNDPKSKLLYSLKPYLRRSKQDKLDQYVNLLKISQVADLFKNNKGDVK